MLFVLALQHQRLQNNQNVNINLQTQLFKETIQAQSYLLRESLLKKVKLMKRLKRHGILSDIENNNPNFDFENEIQNQDNVNIINNNETNIFQLRDDSPLIIHHRHHNHHHNHHNNNHNHSNLNHHRRCKSKGIKNIHCLEESQINDETFIQNEKNKCSICLEDYKLGDKISYLPCFHLYHYKCIKKWLKCSTKCPLCKKEVDF